MRNKIVSGIVLTLLLMGMLTLAFSVQPAKADYRIFPTGIYPDDVMNIQWAIDNIPAGGTILLGPGTFNFGSDGSVNIHNDVLIGGSLDEGNNPVTQISGGSNAFACNEPGVRFEIGNITFENARGAPVYITAGESGKIENCHFEDVSPNSEDSLAFGIFASDLDGPIGFLIIENNLIDLFGDDPADDPNCEGSAGIFVQALDAGIEIKNNAIRNVPDCLIFVRNVGFGIIEANLILQREYPNIATALKHGIVVIDYCGQIIDNSILDASGNGIMAIRLVDSHIGNNFLRGFGPMGGAGGICMTGSSDNLVTENGITGDGDFGLFIDDGVGNVISCNDLTGFNAWIAQVYLGPDTHDNTIIDNSFGFGIPIIDAGYNNIVFPPVPWEWEYTFEDEKHGTTLKISTNEQIFQFTAPTKDFSIKKADNMKIDENSILIRYEDKGVRMIATLIKQRSLCIARVKDLQTGEKYLLIAEHVPQ